MYSSSRDSGVGVLAVIPFISISITLVVLAVLMVFSPSEPYILLTVESSGLDVRVDVKPMNNALLIVNGSTVHSASYNGSLEGLRGWARNVTIKWPSGAEYTLLDYLEEHTLVRPYGEYRLYQDHVVKLETEETLRIRRIYMFMGLAAILTLVAILWQPRSRPRRVYRND